VTAQDHGLSVAWWRQRSPFTENNKRAQKLRTVGKPDRFGVRHLERKKWLRRKKNTAESPKRRHERGRGRRAVGGDWLSRRNGRKPRRRARARFAIYKRSQHNDVVILALLQHRSSLNIQLIMEYGRIPRQPAERTLSMLCTFGHVTRSGDTVLGKPLPVYGLTQSGRMYCAASGIGPGV
jgi:hypothetical protein